MLSNYRGKVQEVSGSYPDMKTKISFDKYGDKILPFEVCEDENSVVILLIKTEIFAKNLFY